MVSILNYKKAIPPFVSLIMHVVIDITKCEASKIKKTNIPYLLATVKYRKVNIQTLGIKLSTMRKCEKDDNQDNITVKKRKKAMHAPIRKARQYQYY